MLHIATPIFRYELFSKVYSSIPQHEDITWHVCLSLQSKNDPDGRWRNLIYNAAPSMFKILIYDIDCADSDTVSKRNAMFDNIKDGYFYLLDDDTTLHPKVYELYKAMEAKDFKGMIIGNQINKFGGHRIHAAIPMPSGIDTGSAICCSEILKQVRWKKVEGIFNDYLFWKSCYDILGDKNTILFYEPISIHNALR